MKGNYLLKDKIFIGIHLSLVFFMAILSTYSTCKDYLEWKPPIFLENTEKVVSNLLSRNIPKIYSFVSGCDAGYGFYAPNVRVGNTVMVEANGRGVELGLKTHEGHLMSNVLMGKMVNDMADKLSYSKEGKDTSFVDAIVKLDELMLKNIGVYVIESQEIKCDDFDVHFCFLRINTLKEHRIGEASLDLQKVKSINISKTKI
ncbi:MAG: hypothetical protein ACI85O_002662 [Saprospiraceae bacterium]|jgi:hypothetical protein